MNDQNVGLASMERGKGCALAGSAFCEGAGRPLGPHRAAGRLAMRPRML
jgi:hypothetical protein